MVHSFDDDTALMAKPTLSSGRLVLHSYYCLLAEDSNCLQQDMCRQNRNT